MLTMTALIVAPRGMLNGLPPASCHNEAYRHSVCVLNVPSTAKSYSVIHVAKLNPSLADALSGSVHGTKVSPLASVKSKPASGVLTIVAGVVLITLVHPSTSGKNGLSGSSSGAVVQSIGKLMAVLPLFPAHIQCRTCGQSLHQTHHLMTGTMRSSPYLASASYPVWCYLRSEER